MSGTGSKSVHFAKEDILPSEGHFVKLAIPINHSSSNAHQHLKKQLERMGGKCELTARKNMAPSIAPKQIGSFDLRTRIRFV